MRKGVVAGTLKNYSGAWRRFTAFCAEYQFPIHEPSEKLLCLFATWRFVRDGVAPGTIDGDIYGIRNQYVRWFRGFSTRDMPSLKLLISGMSKFLIFDFVFLFSCYLRHEK